ncbi:hypothetical protein Tco_0745196 [Tanacetum coccineum]
MLTPRYGYGAVVRYSRLLYESRFRRSSRLFYGSEFGRSSRLFYGQGSGGAPFEPVEEDSPVKEVSPAEAKKSAHGGLNLNEEADILRKRFKKWDQAKKKVAS